MNYKQAFLTAFMVVGITAVANQIPAVKNAINGGNRFFG